MSLVILESSPKSRLTVLLDHFADIDDPRENWRVAFRLQELLLLVVCGTIGDCENYHGIAAWGDTHPEVLRRYAPYHHGVPTGRWLTLLMNRIPPGLFAAPSWPGCAPPHLEPCLPMPISLTAGTNRHQGELS